MTNKVILIFFLILFLLCAAESSKAGSIWAKRDKNMRDVYADDVARHIGDIITILISEDSKVDNKAKRDLKKEVDKATSFNGELGIGTPNHNLLPRMPGFTMAAES